jgi:carboxylesterase
MMNKDQSSIVDRSEWIPGGRVGVLLIHGLGGTPVELRTVSRALSKAGYTVYTMQLAGHCGLPEELRQSTWQEWYASVEAAHDRMKEHCDVVIAGGLSLGAILGIHLAQNRPSDVHGLLLLAPTLRLDGWSMPWYARVLSWVRPTRIKLELELAEHEPYGLKDERVRALVVKGMQSGDSGQAGFFFTPLRALANMNALVARVKKRLGEVKQHALIIHPRVDDMASFNNAIQLQQQLGGLTDVVVLNDSYHIVTLDQQRGLVADRCVRFTADVAQAQAELAGRARLKALRVAQ